MSSSTPPFEFAGPLWLAAAADLFADMARREPDRRFPIVCEVYRNIPAHLCVDGRTSIAWTRRAGDGVASLALEECCETEADVKIVGDYAACRELARFVVSPETAEAYRSLIAKAVAEQRMSVIDKRSPDIPPNYEAHNAIARFTL